MANAASRILNAQLELKRVPLLIDRLLRHMQETLPGTNDHHDLGEKTTTLLLGSRNNADGPRSLNIVTVLEKCDKRYPGLMKLYADLSESAHPSFEGLCAGYSKIDHDEFETNFSNRWMELHGNQHLDSMKLCMGTFDHEYDGIWPTLMEKLEGWIEANDAVLESTKTG